MTTDEMLTIKLEEKPTIWLKQEHDLYRGVRIGMWQYYEDSTQTVQHDLEKLLTYVNKLKAILDTRENILNKKERKLLRQKKAKDKNGTIR